MPPWKQLFRRHFRPNAPIKSKPNNTMSDSQATNAVHDKHSSDVAEKEVIQVRPRLPTLAGDREKQPLVGTDLLIGIPFPSVHVVSGILDVDRFSEALVKTLHYFPEFAGRLKHDEATGEWWVAYTNSPISITIARNQPYDPRLDHDYVLHDNRDDLLGLSEPMKIFGLVNSDDSLLTVKLGFYPQTQQTVIGLTISHIIADGYHVLEFSSALSSFYDGTEPLYPLPKAFKPIVPLPPPEFTPELLTALGSLDPRVTASKHRDFDTLMSDFAADPVKSAPVHIRVTQAQGQKLVQGVFDLTSKSGEAVKVSTTDAITSLVTAILNRHLPKERTIEYVWNTVNIRNAIPAEALAHNTLILLPSRHIPVLPDVGKDFIPMSEVARISSAIRLSLNETRAPGSPLLIMFAIAQQQFKDAANRGEIYSVLNAEGSATVNSNANFDWNGGVNFGYPEGAKYYATWFFDNYLRIFKSNPVLSDPSIPGERHVVDARAGDLDVLFRAQTSIAQAVKEELKAVLAAL